MGTTLQLFQYNVINYISDRYYISSIDYDKDKPISDIVVTLSNYKIYPITIKSNIILNFYDQCEALYSDSYFEYIDQMRRLVDTAMFFSLNNISKTAEIDIKAVLDRSMKSFTTSRAPVSISGNYYIAISLECNSDNITTHYRYYISSISVKRSGHYDFEISNMKYNSINYVNYKEIIPYYIYIIKHPNKILSEVRYKHIKDSVTSMTIELNYYDSFSTDYNSISTTLNNIKTVGWLI